ncbi:uncharacterized protein L969DRAFT_46427 [Mixia osmundae IAM 14324]|uniref:Major facilitator superfamily (MFS) profile domain-containing protein n=1 Tax=Mixia osmundae (strain CBS 9802 / IAM 14324 / JCM 22182 / KY 12970) TaxID=764103 RepID=G7DSB7_MIXOS|nr:uncharacterized protein L969DRAFT_46427 [Mixia osmundae IAM 14324]KEI40929.1 hypothetical protein L969DRAFT_46427 [Mixia osmundae IAM 14324]GAA93477.1 hypothetical protein E5Q_00118 [Mixia osmundae IAM 14324]
MDTIEQRPSADASNDSKSVSPTRQPKEKREKAGAKWQAQETQEIPKNNLFLVFTGLMLTVFLAAMDQTILAPAIPTIVRDLNDPRGYSWIGSAYLLTAAAFSPLYGKLSDLIGRKIVLYFGIAMFLFGSALCGAAKNMVWLCSARGVQGIGGGAIIQMVQIVISDIVPLKDRGKYAGAIGSVWGIASIIGPTLGGLLVQRVSWVWIFYINLPTGGFAAALLFFFLNVNPPSKKRTLRQHIRAFDFSGLFFLVVGVVCLLVAFNLGETDWSAPPTIALLVVGPVLLVAGVFNEIYVEQYLQREPIVPPRLFHTRTTGIVLFTVFIHAFSFFGVSYVLPTYFQILGSNALLSGVKMLPLSLGSAVMAIVSGQIVARTGKYKPSMWCGWFFMTLGFGLLILLRANSSIAEQEILPLIAAVGIGQLFQTPLLALQASIPMASMATATGAFGFIRTLSGAIGIAVSGSIYGSLAKRNLMNIPNFDASVIGGLNNVLATNLPDLKHLQPPELREEIMAAFCDGIRIFYVVCAPLCFIGFLSTFGMRSYSLNREVVRLPGKDKIAPGDPVPTDAAKSDDIEKGSIQSEKDEGEAEKSAAPISTIVAASAAGAMPGQMGATNGVNDVPTAP